MDIYFREEYAKIYELNGDGNVEKFNYKSEKGRVEYLFLKRPIETNLGKYYDIITPYGYGGPLFFPKDSKYIKLLISGFRREFEKYCRENQIVSEFIRFHPILKNHRFMEKYMETKNVGPTAYIALTSEEDILSNMNKSCRKTVRKSERQGLKVEIDNSEESWNRFIELYYMVMNKNTAENYYYFSKKYFQNIRALLKEKVTLFKAVYEGKIISAMVVLSGKESIHGHLHATDPKYYNKSPNNLLIYSASLWGLKNGYKSLHLGGGVGGMEDALFKFKNSFNKNGILEFYVGKKVLDSETYDTLNQLHEENNPEIKGKRLEFFPLYRR